MLYYYKTRKHKVLPSFSSAVRPLLPLTPPLSRRPRLKWKFAGEVEDEGEREREGEVPIEIARARQ